MAYGDDLDERDDKGELTPWALACRALQSEGCDCGTDEPGTCLVCLCEAALRAERQRAEQACLHEAAMRAERKRAEQAERKFATLADAVTGVSRSDGHGEC